MGAVKAIGTARDRTSLAVAALDSLPLRTALRSELIEERLERIGVLVGLRPDDVAASMVHHHGDVLVVSSIGQLVDADLRESIEGIAVLAAGNDPLDDRADS